MIEVSTVQFLLEQAPFSNDGIKGACFLIFLSWKFASKSRMISGSSNFFKINMVTINLVYY